MYSVGVGNDDHAMDVVRHREHHDGCPFVLGGQVIGRREDGCPTCGVVEVTDLPVLMAERYEQRVVFVHPSRPLVEKVFSDAEIHAVRMEAAKAGSNREMP